ncbi:PucR family transcriptional regulator [Clostridium thailandense]|uniref:PucR family transcriptional regulator n=1 Tax=Clostridium thailandense TaxID=2794346 RepID=UPI003989ABB2
MDMKLNILIEKLEHYTPKLHLYSREDVPIKSAKLLFKNQQSFEPCVLYIGKTSFLPKNLNYSCSINLLCIKESPIPDSYKESCPLNLIIIDNHCDLSIIFNEIQDMLTEFHQWSSSLMDSLINNKGLDQIIDIGYNFLNNPILIIDTSFKLLEYKKNIEFNDPLWKATVIKGYMPYECVATVKAIKYVEQVYSSRSPIARNFVTEKYGKSSTMVANIILSNKIFAHIVIFESQRSFKKMDFEITNFLCKVISSEMQKVKFFQNTKILIYECFIEDLLDGNIKDNEVIEERVKYLDLNLKENLYVLTIALSHFNEENTPIIQIKDYLEYIISDSKSIIYKNYIVMLISRRRKNLLFEEDFKTLKRFLYDNKLFGGLSRCFTKLVELQKHFVQSLKAVNLGIRMHSKKTLFIYDNYTVYHMMENHSAEELKTFCHPSLLTLMEYDKQNNTTYLESLYTYISRDRNKVESADLLHIHRNTMSYRISKIKEIIDVDLDDRDLIFHLSLSFKILEFTDKINFS